MSGYVRSIDFNGEFEGEPVTCKLKQLSFHDMLKLEATEVASDEDAARVIAEIVPGYVTDFSGPKAADGSEVNIQEVCSMAYFTELSMAIGRKLVAASRPPRKPS